MMAQAKTKRTLKMIVVPMLMVVCGFAAYVSAAIECTCSLLWYEKVFFSLREI